MKSKVIHKKFSLNKRAGEKKKIDGESEFF